MIRSKEKGTISKMLRHSCVPQPGQRPWVPWRGAGPQCSDEEQCWDGAAGGVSHARHLP